MFMTHSLLKKLDFINVFILLCKGKIFPLQVRLWPSGYSSTYFMNTALEWGEWSAAHAGRTLPQERHSTHCTGG
jgi:hypothetical protein